MKKFLITLFVALSMALCGCSNSQSGSNNSEDTTEQTDDGSSNIGPFAINPKDGVIEAPTFGFKMTLPDSLKEVEDDLVFLGFTQMEFAYGKLALKDGDDPNVSNADLINILAYREEIDVSEFISDDEGITEDMIHYLGTNGTLYYYGVYINDPYKADPDKITNLMFPVITEENHEKFIEYLGKTDGALDNVEFTDLTLPELPSADNVDSAALMDMQIKDLDGKDVRLGDYVQDNKVTVLNFWGTFCGPCIIEMPFLQQLSEQYKDQGVAVVGLTSDIMDEEDNIQDDLVEDARAIIEDTGVKYPILIATQEVLEHTSISVYPTTYIVDSNGNLLTDPIMGSRDQDEWIRIVEKAIEKAE